MADTRSAAGEGSEPGVPNRDQPAQELANLIAESDAKGKGFWRRRRRKSATTTAPPTGTPAPDPTAVDPTGTTPAAEPEPKSAEPASDVASSVNAEDTPDTAAQTPDSKATEGDGQTTDGQTTDGQTTGGQTPEAQTAEGQTTDGQVAEAVPAAKAKKSSKKSSKQSAGDPAVDRSSDASSTEAQDADASATTDVPAAEDPTEQPAADGAAAEQSASEDSSGEQPPAEPARPAVGVVYEPDESPDGFPLEYGNIIVGLPKSGAGESAADAEPAEATESAEGSPESPGADNPTGDAETAEEAAAAPDDAVEVTAEASDEANPGEPAEHPDGTSDRSDAEPGSIDAQPADDQRAATDAEGAPEQSGEAAEQSGTPEQSGETAEQSDIAEQSEVPEQSEGAEGPDAASGDAEAAAEPTEGADQAAAQADATSEQSDAAAEQSEGTSDQSQSAEQAATEGAESGDQSADAEAESSAGQTDGADQSGADADQSGAEDAESGAGADESGADAEGPASGDADSGDGQATDAEAGASGEQSGDEESGEGSGERSGDGQPGAGSGEAQAGGQSDAEAEQAEGASEQAEGAADGEAAAGEASEGEEPEELTAEQMAERMAAEQAAMALITALMRLRGAFAASQLPIDVVGADEARQQQKAMLDQLDDYVLPRLVQLEAPVLAVVGGSTGAGKSTLVNSIIGKVVSEPGVLRPTTRSPVLIHHPADADWFAGDRVLPGMARSSGESPGGMEDPGQLRLVAADTVPQGLAILDAPDIDSVVEANRDLATQLLAAADLWLFVTTAARYADAVPWDFLQSASDRSTAVAVVLDRAPEDTIDDITGHLAQMLLERGLGESPLFSIKETVVDGNGMLPAETVASIKDWLIDLAADAEARAAVVRRTLHGAVTAMVKKTPPFAEAVRAQAETIIELRSTAETAYDRAVKDVAKATQDGTLLRGEVLARWQEFVGTGELLKGLQTNVGRMRDKMKATVVGKPPPTRDLNDAVESGLESLLREHAEAAAERAEESWQSTAPGRQLLAAGDRDMGRMSKDFPAAAGRAVRDWQGYVLDLVRKEGADKRSTARILAYGVNGLGLSLMVVIFASTAGITGAEVGVGAGAAVVGQKLLEAVFGDQAVRTLVAKAREDLDGRVHALMDAEFARYLAVLDQHPVDPEAARQLTEAARAVEDCT